MSILINIETALENISIRISDILGQNMIPLNHQKVIDISQLNQGIYLIQIYQNGTLIEVNKLVKE